MHAIYWPNLSGKTFPSARLIACCFIRIETEGEERTRVKRLIDQLHTYNECKDVAQALIGKLALIEGCTTKELYPRFDLNLDD